MEALDIFNRETGTWSRKYRVQVGFREYWLLDKTTDYLENLHIVYREDPANYDDPVEPPFKIMDWARFYHVENIDEQASYTDEGLPLNHSQYVIGGIQKRYDPINGKWHVQLKLIEPIERFRGVLGETLSYTNQTSKTVDGVIYTKEPYNHYTALERWLKVTPANCDTYGTGYDRARNISWFNRLRILDEQWLRSLPFNDDTFNELTLYDLLLDVFDSSTGRTPVAYFDMTPATDLPRNLARDEYILKFERQDGYDKEPLDYQRLTQKWRDIGMSEICSSVIKREDLSNFATGLVSNVENLSSGEGINFPAQGIYAVPEVNADIRGTLQEAKTPASDNWILRFPHAVKKITKLQRITIGGYYSNKDSSTGLKTINLKRIIDESTNILERKEYLALEGEPSSREDIYWFIEGDNKLHLKDYGHQYAEVVSNNKLYYVEYEPLINPRIAVGDNEFVQQLNQNSSQVDNGKFASFMNNYLASMGKADVAIERSTRHIANYADYAGRRVIDAKHNREYIITSVSYENRNENYTVVLLLNENHLRKNSSYTASHEIRKNTIIEYNNLKDRKTAIKQTTSISIYPLSQEGYWFFNHQDVLSGLFSSETELNIHQAYLTLKSNFMEKRLVVNIAPFSFGNQICINLQMLDNVDAGKKKFTLDTDVPPYNSEKPFRRVSSQIPVLYTDLFGEVNLLDIDFVRVFADSLSPYPEVTVEGASTNVFPIVEAEYERTVDAYNKLLSYPETYNAQTSIVYGSVKNLNLLKDQLEQLNINTVLDIKSKDLIVCAGLAKNSRLMPRNTRTIRLCFYDRFKSENDSYQEGLVQAIDNPSITLESNTITYNYNVASAPQSIIVYYVDEAGNAEKMLIANLKDDNIKTEAQNYFRIYY